MERDETDSPSAGLTDSEWRIARAVGAGASNKAVARDLTISIKTVEFHLGNVYRKLGIATRSELANLIGSRSSRVFHKANAGGNLPRARSSLIGRESAIARLIPLVGTWPMVTVIGPGGVGKTRLALAVGHAMAQHFSDGVWLIELASVANGRDVPSCAAIALGLSTSSSNLSANDVANSLGRQQRLVILDNCEHVADDAATLARAIVDRCPNVTVLGTSRERLGITDEHVVTVPAMSVEPVDGRSPAVTLFIERASAADGSFRPTPAELEVVDDLCRRLDGLPLAIELAAARLASLSLHDVVGRLDDRFDLLTQRRPTDDRHRSLLTTIEWSYDLLTPDEQRTFESLGAFAGDFDAAAARAVSIAPVTARQLDDRLASLVEQSMVIAIDGPTGRRFTLLDSIRDFARRQLQARDDDLAVQRLYLDHFRRFLHEADIEVRGVDELPAHIAILTEWHHIRAAMATACELDDGPVAAAMIRDVLWWAIIRMRAEVGDWAERVRLLPSIASGPERTVATTCAAFFAYMRNDVPRARELVELARDDERQFGEMAEPWIPAVEMFFADDPISLTLETQQRAQRAESSFWETLGILQETVVLSTQIATGALQQRAGDEAMARIVEAMEMAERLGNQNDIAYGARNLGGALWRTDPVRARALLERALTTAVPLGLELLAGQARGALAVIHIQGGRPAEALHLMAAALEAHVRAGALSELAVDLAPCVRPLVAVGELDVARLTVDALEVAHGELVAMYDMNALDLPRSLPRTGASPDLVDAASRVIAASSTYPASGEPGESPSTG